MAFKKCRKDVGKFKKVSYLCIAGLFGDFGMVFWVDLWGF
jgi:hypothetical protein